MRVVNSEKLNERNQSLSDADEPVIVKGYTADIEADTGMAKGLRFANHTGEPIFIVDRTGMMSQVDPDYPETHTGVQMSAMTDYKIKGLAITLLTFGRNKSNFMAQTGDPVCVDPSDHLLRKDHLEGFHIDNGRSMDPLNPNWQISKVSKSVVFISARTLARHGGIYYDKDLDIQIVTSKALAQGWEKNRYSHPFSPGATIHRTLKEAICRRETVTQTSNEDTSKPFLDAFFFIVDNADSLGSYYIRLGSRALLVPKRKNPVLRNGLYAILPPQVEDGSFSHNSEPTYFTMEEAMKEFEIYRSIEEAIVGGYSKENVDRMAQEAKVKASVIKEKSAERSARADADRLVREVIEETNKRLAQREKELEEIRKREQASRESSRHEALDVFKMVAGFGIAFVGLCAAVFKIFMTKAA